MSSKKYQELEDIVLENTILIKKNRALVSINHDNLHGAYRESYDVTRELLLLQLERARKFINEKTSHTNLFEYLKKRIEINKKTASVTEKIISSNEIMMEALEESKVVNQELVEFLENSLNNYKKQNKSNSRKKTILKKEIKYSYVFVFELDKYDQIVESKVFNTKDIKNIKFSNDKTSNEIVKRGLLEKIFGGVGTQQELPTTP